MDIAQEMAPVRIRYHVPDKPEVIRYNDPLTDRQKQQTNRHRVHFNKKKKRKRDRTRDNVSDFEYDYSPRERDFEHMRRSVPDKYWGPYHPEVYEGKRRWDAKEDGKFYDFKYDSNRRTTPYGREGYEGDFDYDPNDYEYRRSKELERRERDFGHDRGYDSDRDENNYHRPGHDTYREYGHERGYDSDQGRHHNNHNGYDNYRQFGHDRGYDTDHSRPQYGFDYYRGPPVRERADYQRPSDDYRRHPYDDRHTRRDVYDSYGYPPSWRPPYVQSEIILPRDRLRPLPYMGDPNRKPHEHRRVPAPQVRKPKMHHYQSPRHETNHGHHRIDGVETYYSDPIDWYARARYTEDARVALVRKRQRNAHCGACPEKSSKYVPTMHYDELRCQHCLDRVRPTQDEILAYPWTVQTYRTNNATNNVPTVVTPAFSAITPSVYTAGGGLTNRTDHQHDHETRTNANTKLMTGPSRATNIANDDKISLPKSEPKEQGSKVGNSVANNNNNNKHSIGAVTNAKVVADRAAKSKNKSKDSKTAVSEGKENKKVAGNDPETKETSPKVGPANSGTALTKKSHKVPTRPLSVVHENQEDDNNSSLLVEHNLDLEDYDDIRPQDSVSNVRLPPLRAYPIEPNMTGRYSPLVTKPRAQTELTAYSYPPGRYFPSLEYIPPPPAQATPLPKNETRSERSRRLRGEYLDWRSGRKYEYDINYRGRRVMADRRPLR